MVSDTAEFFHPQRELSQVSQEQKELLEKLRDEAEQKEQLRKLKNEMESERWHLDKTIEKLQKEVRGQAAEQRQVGPGEPSASSCKGSGNPSSPKPRCTWMVPRPCSHSLDSAKTPDARNLAKNINTKPLRALGTWSLANNKQSWPGVDTRLTSGP